MDLEKYIEKKVIIALKKLGVDGSIIPKNIIRQTPESKFGDYATTIAIELGKRQKVDVASFAKEIVLQLEEDSIIKKVEALKSGYINFYLSDKAILKFLERIQRSKKKFGRNNIASKEVVMVEYTDPNPFKKFHIGHLMTNSIGECLANLAEISGAKVYRANYQGDVGAHVAKAIFGMLQSKEELPASSTSLEEKMNFLGEAYVLGAKQYKENIEAKKKIEEINKKVYEKEDKEIISLYKKGRSWSLEHFEKLYKTLNTKFDYYFFESNVWKNGIKIVKEQLDKGVFEKSEEAVVFPGEKYGLHTRVFISSKGLPTYECKEVSLNIKKFKKQPNITKSIVITAVEQTEYFKVVMCAMKQFVPDIVKKTEHITHGMMLGSSGSKMSSRAGDVVSGEDLLIGLREKILTNFERVKDEKLAMDIAVAALKYMVLKQKTGKNIVYNEELALSTDGDSGPYIQYTHARCLALLRKAKKESVRVNISQNNLLAEDAREVIHNLLGYEKIIQQAYEERAPQILTTYLIKLGRTFNSWYAKQAIVDKNDDLSPQRIVVAEATSIALSNGLRTLGINAPNKL